MKATELLSIEGKSNVVKRLFHHFLSHFNNKIYESVQRKNYTKSDFLISERSNMINHFFQHFLSYFNNKSHKSTWTIVKKLLMVSDNRVCDVMGIGTWEFLYISERMIMLEHCFFIRSTI